MAYTEAVRRRAPERTFSERLTVEASVLFHKTFEAIKSKPQLALFFEKGGLQFSFPKFPVTVNGTQWQVGGSLESVRGDLQYFVLEKGRGNKKAGYVVKKWKEEDSATPSLDAQVASFDCSRRDEMNSPAALRNAKALLKEFSGE